jgi:hypothetical protein
MWPIPLRLIVSRRVDAINEIRSLRRNNQLTQTQQRLRHRKSERSCKGNSDARIASDSRNLIHVSTEVFTKYSGSFLKYFVRPKNGVGRPALVRRQQLALAEANSQIRGLEDLANVSAN